MRCLSQGLCAVIVLLLPAVASAQQAETIEYYGTDAIGSIRIVWDANGNVLGRQDYAPFGKALFPIPAMPKEGFVANEQDAETDQSNFHARMFEARTGRFTRPDPIGAGLFEPQRWNRYSYALSNPATDSDPSGLLAAAPPGNPFTCDNPAAYEELHCSYYEFVSMMESSGGGASARSGQDTERTPGGGTITTKSTDSDVPEDPDVTNNTNNTIFVKDEHDEKRDERIDVQPGKTWLGVQDGIADPCGHPGQVFKTTNHVDVTISPYITLTNVSPTVPFPKSLYYGAGQFTKGGWKGSNFLQEHGDWSTLFKEASTPPPGGCK